MDAHAIAKESSREARNRGASQTLERCRSKKEQSRTEQDQAGLVEAQAAETNTHAKEVGRLCSVQ